MFAGPDEDIPEHSIATRISVLSNLVRNCGSMTQDEEDKDSVGEEERCGMSTVRTLLGPARPDDQDQRCKQRGST